MTGPRTTRTELLAPVSRWTWLAKFWLCDGIRRGTISVAEAKRSHALTDEELNRWYSLFQDKGGDGLRNINKNRRRAA
jgi:hypothetical protein